MKVPDIDIAKRRIAELEAEVERLTPKPNHKVGDWWLTKEGRAEIKNTWLNSEYNDGNVVLPLLYALENAELALTKISNTLEVFKKDKKDREDDEV